MTELDTISKKPESQADPRAIRAIRQIGPEDLYEGQYVVQTQVIYEFPSFCWCTLESISHPPEKPIRVPFHSPRDERPLKVLSICLPFVFCENEYEGHQVVDLRQCKLAEVDAAFGKRVFDAFSPRKQSSKKKKRKRKGKKKQKK